MQLARSLDAGDLGAGGLRRGIDIRPEPEDGLPEVRRGIRRFSGRDGDAVLLTERRLDRRLTFCVYGIKDDEFSEIAAKPLVKLAQRADGRDRARMIVEPQNLLRRISARLRSIFAFDCRASRRTRLLEGSSSSSSRRGRASAARQPW